MIKNKRAFRPLLNLLVFLIYQFVSMIGDQVLPESKRITRTTAPFRLQGKPLQEAGLLGPVKLVKTE